MINYKVGDIFIYDQGITLYDTPLTRFEIKEIIEGHVMGQPVDIWSPYTVSFDQDMVNECILERDLIKIEEFNEDLARLINDEESY